MKSAQLLGGVLATITALGVAGHLSPVIAVGPDQPPPWYIAELNGWSKKELREYKRYAAQARSSVWKMPCKSAYSPSWKRTIVNIVYAESDAGTIRKARNASYLLYGKAWGHCD